MIVNYRCPLGVEHNAFQIQSLTPPCPWECHPPQPVFQLAAPCGAANRHLRIVHRGISGTLVLEAVRLNYIGPMNCRPRYHADDASRDILSLDPHSVAIEDARGRARPHTLSVEGFELVSHKSDVENFHDPQEVGRYRLETQRLLLDLTGADEVAFSANPVRRSGTNARLTISGQLLSSHHANFVHVDISDVTASALSKRLQPRHRLEPVRRFAHYNLWRAVSPPPHDAPLAVCDPRSVSPSDLVEADAIMDIPGKKESSYVGLVIRYNPSHCWSYYSGMERDELLVFKAFDSDVNAPSQVAHTAFADPSCPAGVTPRSSIEMRAIAYWYGG